MTDAELKPCLFCGGGDILRRDGPTEDDWVAFYCNDCGAQGPQNYTDRAAIAAWNRRSDLCASGQQVQALVEASQQLLDGMSASYRAGNNRQVSIQADDGEKCWIVHSDLTHELECALAALTPAPEAAQTEAVAWLIEDYGPTANKEFAMQYGKRTEQEITPLYAHPPAAQDSVREAALKWAELEKESESRISMGGWSTKAQELDLFEAEEAMKDAALRALAGKGGA